MRFLYALEIVALALWTGAAVGFGLIAPALFAIIPSRQLAGEVAGEAIARVETLGLAAGIAALLALTARRQRDASPSRRYRWLLVLAMVGMIALDARVIHRRLDQIQAQMDRPIEEYAKTDPLRAEYGRWHGISMLVGTVATGLGAIALVWAAASPPRPPESES